MSPIPLLVLAALELIRPETSQEKEESPLPPVVAQRLADAKSSLERRYLALDEAKRKLAADGKEVVPGSAREKALLARKQEILGQMAAYKADLEDYERDKALELRIADTRLKIEKATKRLEKYQSALDEWTELPLEARKKAHEAAMKAAATVLLGNLESRVEARQAKEVPLREGALERIRGLLERKVLGEPHYSKLPGLQARTLEKLQALKTEGHLVELLKLVKGGLDSLPAEANREEILSALLGAIGYASHDPALELLIADGELVIADLYVGAAASAAGARIDQLLELGEGQLREIKSLSDLYKKQIDERKTLAQTRGSR